MLPGLRILFAITLLSVSVVIFGLGAAAFLRSAHEDVANAPWRPIETPATARVDLAPATLAMLRVEPETTIAVALPKAEAAASSPPMEPKAPETATEPVTAASPQQPPRAEQTPLAAQPPEAPIAPVTADPPPATAAAAEPARDPAPPVAETKAIETPPADTKAADTKAPETTEPQPGSTTVVAALAPDKPGEPQPQSAVEPAPAPPVAETVPEAAPPAAEASPGTDTLKEDDKTIKSTPAARVATLGEPATAETPPLPSTEVKIPAPRVDPSVIEARRKQQLVAQQRARASAAAKARRIAAARRAAAKAAAAAATNPFGAPANSTTSNIRTN